MPSWLAQKLGQPQPISSCIPTGMHGPACIFRANLSALVHAWTVFPPAALASHDIVCSPAAVQPDAFARPQCKAADAEDNIWPGVFSALGAGTFGPGRQRYYVPVFTERAQRYTQP
jgi:hypothetical protein